MDNVHVGDGPNNDLRTRGSVTAGHSTLVVVLSFLVGALIAGCPLGIMFAVANQEVEEMTAPEWDWSFEGECSDFNSSHWGPGGFDPSAFSFEFIVPSPHMGIAMTNTMRPNTPSAKPVPSSAFFNHLAVSHGYNAILRVHKSPDSVAVQLPFTTTGTAGPCKTYPPDWEHTIVWSCASLSGNALWGKEHKMIAAEPLKSMNCSLFVDLHSAF
jgi:hypothetical protein